MITPEQLELAQKLLASREHAVKRLENMNALIQRASDPAIDDRYHLHVAVHVKPNYTSLHDGYFDDFTADDEALRNVLDILADAAAVYVRNIDNRLNALGVRPKEPPVPRVRRRRPPNLKAIPND
jgi:hypothetical protein